MRQFGELQPAPDGYAIKLVRDRTPDVINSSGDPGELWYAVGPDDTRERLLRLKLAEEVAEFLVDGGDEELADVYAVVDALAELKGVDLASLAASHPRGGFSRGVVMYGRHDEYDRA